MRVALVVAVFAFLLCRCREGCGVVCDGTRTRCRDVLCTSVGGGQALEMNRMSDITGRTNRTKASTVPQTGFNIASASAYMLNVANEKRSAKTRTKHSSSPTMPAVSHRTLNTYTRCADCHKWTAHIGYM
jgi:hypothetical protein